MEKYIVYLTINLCNGKFYIGVHRTNPDVFDGYIGCGVYKQTQASEKYPFHTAVRKYGYNNFRRTTLRIFDTKEEAYEFEKQLVTQTVTSSKNCYNIQNGGYGGTGYTAKKIYQFDLKGNFIKEWDSIAAAQEALGLHHISDVCNGSRSMCGGFYWNYIKKFEYSPGIDQSKKVAQYTQSGKFLRTWDSLKEAQRSLGIYNINRAIKADILCGGYWWKFFNGDTSDISPKSQKKFSQLLNSKIEQIDLEGNVVKVWDNIEELHKNGFHRKYVRNVLKGNQNTYQGFSFKFIQDEDIVSTFNEN